MKAEDFAPRLLAWYQQHGRQNLPWVGAQPYHIWLSEMMLQQTQVKTVIPYFQRFLEKFTSIAELAQANLDEVLPYWQGLGYYRRAQYLHRAAQYWHEHGMPENYIQWLKLPGIGPSTAAALASFIQHERVSIMDGNVIRVISRLFGIQTHDADFKSFLHTLLPASPKDMPAYTQALMDFGASLCRKKPDCILCPFSASNDCYADTHHMQAQLPYIAPKAAKQRKTMHLLFLESSMGWALAQQNGQGLWPHLYLPIFFDDTQALQNFIHAHSAIEAPHGLGEIQHLLTHRVITMHIYRSYTHAPEHLPSPYLWVHNTRLHQYAMPTPIVKIMHRLNK